MRTRTTTREQTWTGQANFPLKRFLAEKGWDDLVKKMTQLQYIKVITDARELTDDPERVKIISSYITSRRNCNLCE